MMLSQTISRYEQSFFSCILTSSSWFSSTVMSCSIFDDNIVQPIDIVAFYDLSIQIYQLFNAVFLLYKCVMMGKRNFQSTAFVVSMCAVYWHFTISFEMSKSQEVVCLRMKLMANFRKCGEFKYCSEVLPN